MGSLNEIPIRDTQHIISKLLLMIKKKLPDLRLFLLSML